MSSNSIQEQIELAQRQRTNALGLLIAASWKQCKQQLNSQRLNLASGNPPTAKTAS